MAKTREYLREYHRQWRLRNQDKFREIQRRSYQKYIEKRREHGRVMARKKRADDPDLNRKKQKQWRDNNLEWARERERLWCAKNRERLAAKNHARYWSDPEKFRRKARERRARSIQKKGFRYRPGYPTPTRVCPELCECCGQRQVAKRKWLDLDHCHKTGIFRGWLCWKCNHAIGVLGDSVEGLLRAVAYLKRAYGNSSIPNSSSDI